MPQKTPKKSNTYVKKPPFPTILAHCDRCPPFRDIVFSGATHHSGLADIVKKRNPQIRSRISRKSIPGTANACRRWVSTNEGDDPEIVLAGCGDNLTLEVMAAAQILRREVPEWRLLKQMKKPTAISLSRALKNLGARSGPLFLQSVTTA